MGSLRQLPPQLFGEHRVITLRSVNEMQDMVAHVKGWRGEYGTLAPTNEFVCKTSVLNVNGTKLTCVVHTPMHTWVQSDHSSTLFVPLTGQENCSRVNGKDLFYAPGQTAAFAPEGVRTGQGGLRSILMIDIDKQRLRETIGVMTGKTPRISGDLHAPMSVNLRAGSLRFDQMLRHVCSMADQFSGAPDLLNRSGLDDVIYRTLGTMFAPAELVGAIPDISFNDRHSFNVIRDYLMAHLAEPITLTELERMSGLSARTLQYQFARYAGMSPMAWLKKQRLIKARQMLQQPGGVRSVTELAMDLCFSSASRFAAEYRQQFGRAPSDDLKAQ